MIGQLKVQWCKNHRHCSKMKTVMGLDESSLLSQAGKITVSDHIYPVIKHASLDGSGLFQDDNSLMTMNMKMMN